MRINLATLKIRDASVMSGIDKHITSSITINGTPYTPAELKAEFQSEIIVLEANDALNKSRADGVMTQLEQVTMLPAPAAAASCTSRMVTTLRLEISTLFFT